ncbi:MAG: HAD family hydrolase [Candidatus Marinimicrobia bacterium]|nr:HAD family hydrolase [Candidatus Neomarinimicrobiota bacterium]
MAGNKQLILFDIDGTILHPGKLARKLMDEVVTEKVGRSPDLQFTDVAGFTDPVIMRSALKKLGINESNFTALVDELLTRYLVRLRQTYPNYQEPKLYKDSIELVHRCKAEGWHVGLLSGNIREGAKIKLSRFNVWNEFDFGVFGDEVVSREDLLCLARERAWDELSEAYTYDQMVMVGDTPNDVRIANLNHVRSLIVCRYPEWWSKIEEKDPTWLVDSFKDVDTIMEWLFE